jgi:hypothetical protein
VAVVVLAGCATLSKDSPPDVKAAAVKERSSARWAALIKGDKDAAYAYLSPGTREVMSLEAYKRRINTDGFRAVQIQGVDCEVETCKVKLMLTYDHAAPKGATRAVSATTYIEETWLLDKGQAWFVWHP